MQQRCCMGCCIREGLTGISGQTIDMVDGTRRAETVATPERRPTLGDPRELVSERTATPARRPAGSWRADTSGMWHAGRVLAEDERVLWLSALEDFTRAQRAKGIQPATVRQRVKHVRAFAIAVKLPPWHVTADDVLLWAQALTGAAATRSAMRSSVRAFYRWAKEAQRIVGDPTVEVSHRGIRKPVPPQWERPLTAYERYLWAQGTAPSSVRAYLETLRTFARESKHLEPFAVTQDDLYEWMAGKRWARETRRGKKATVRGFYRWAVATERMQADPTEHMPVVRAGDPVARPATDAEYAAALAAARDPRWKLALRLAAELGLRRAEVARVHSADIVRRDDGSRWLIVHGKGSKVRRVPLPDGLHAALSALPAGYVFPGQMIERHAHAGTQGHLSPRYLGKRLAELLPADVTMHMLRHRFATKAYNVDRDVFTVQRLLGHASPATTQRYVQVADERMRALVEAVSG